MSVSARVTAEVIVVSFDMCSSSNIMEELTLKADLIRLQRFLITMKRYLGDQQNKVSFEPYKFTGDGWILLFPAGVDGGDLLRFLTDLCLFYKGELRKQVLKYLDTPPKINGLTFGLERGLLGVMRMFGRKEYVGRPLNIACRLQSAIKDKDSSPAYKALVSNAVFNDYFESHMDGYKVYRVKRTLRNIRAGNEFRCRKIHLLDD